MSKDQEDSLAIIEPLFRDLHDSLLDGMTFYSANYTAEAVAQHRDRTAANCVYDHAFHSLKERRGSLAGNHFLKLNGLEVLNFEDRALIRLKKVNGAGRARNLLTAQQEAYDNQEDLPGLPPAAVRLVAGYQPDAAFTAIERVIVSKPLGKTILWAAQIVVAADASSWFDITPARLAGTERTDFRTNSNRRRQP